MHQSGGQSWSWRSLSPIRPNYGSYALLKFSESLCRDDPVLTLRPRHLYSTQNESVAQSIAVIMCFSLRWTTVFTSVHARQRKIHAYLISFLLRKSAGAKVTGSDKALFFFFLKQDGEGETTLIKSRKTLTVNYSVSLSDALKVQQNVRDEQEMFFLVLSTYFPKVFIHILFILRNARSVRKH